MARTPIKRFKDTIRKKNLWVYIVYLAKDKEVLKDEVRRLLLEEFDFLPSTLRTRKVLFRLEQDGYISKERYKSKKAYKATEKGIKELEEMISYTEEIVNKLKK